MDVLHRRGHATAQEVLEDLEDAPSYSAVRAVLRLLEERGHVKHVPDGRRYIFTPATPKRDASEEALSHLVQTFFEGSAEAAVTALLPRLSAAETKRIKALLSRTMG
jgi:predicted transcriptional regulator